jgi:SHS2 domain-containing protein
MEPEGEGFKFIEHTADVMFEAYGKDFPEAISNAAKAMFSITGHANPKKKFVLEIESTSLELLVVDTLAQLLAESDIREMVLSKIEVKKFDPNKFTLSLVAYGEHKPPRDSIKAVTYHELAVEKSPNGWRIQVLLDI